MSQALPRPGAAALPALVVLTAAGGLVLMRLLPETSPLFPPCPVHAATGLWCPGCGSTRAMRALSRGDVGLAARQNVALMLALPYLAFTLTAWARVRTLGPGRHLRPRPLSRATGLVVLAAVALYTLVRNLPGQFLAPF